MTTAPRWVRVLESAGWTDDDIMAVVPSLAVFRNADEGAAAMASLRNAYGMPAIDAATHVYHTVVDGVMSDHHAADAWQRLAPSAAASGMPAGVVVSLLVSMTRAGIAADVAVSVIRDALVAGDG